MTEEIYPAYRAWHCGRMGCDAELVPSGDDLVCETCGTRFRPREQSDMATPVNDDEEVGDDG